MNAELQFLQNIHGFANAISALNRAHTVFDITLFFEMCSALATIRHYSEHNVETKLAPNYETLQQL